MYDLFSLKLLNCTINQQEKRCDLFIPVLFEISFSFNFGGLPFKHTKSNRFDFSSCKCFVSVCTVNSKSVLIKNLERKFLILTVLHNI